MTKTKKMISDLSEDMMGKSFSIF